MPGRWHLPPPEPTKEGVMRRCGNMMLLHCDMIGRTAAEMDAVLKRHSRTA